MPLAVAVEVLEQFVPRQFRAALHDLPDARIVDCDVVLDAAFAAKAKSQLARFDLYVLLAQRRQSV